VLSQIGANSVVWGQSRDTRAIHLIFCPQWSLSLR
jgi:hypothetical protein